MRSSAKRRRSCLSNAMHSEEIPAGQQPFKVIAVPQAITALNFSTPTSGPRNPRIRSMAQRPTKAHFGPCERTGEDWGLQTTI